MIRRKAHVGFADYVCRDPHVFEHNGGDSFIDFIMSAVLVITGMIFIFFPFVVTIMFGIISAKLRSMGLFILYIPLDIYIMYYWYSKKFYEVEQK